MLSNSADVTSTTGISTITNIVFCGPLFFKRFRKEKPSWQQNRSRKTLKKYILKDAVLPVGNSLVLAEG